MADASSPPESVTASLWCVQDVVRAKFFDSAPVFYARVTPVVSFDEQDSYTRYKSVQALLLLLGLSSSIQICATIHDCSIYGCSPAPSRAGVAHCPQPNVIDDIPFFLLRREDRYPPRSGQLVSIPLPSTSLSPRKGLRALISVPIIESKANY